MTCPFPSKVPVQLAMLGLPIVLPQVQPPMLMSVVSLTVLSQSADVSRRRWS